MHLKSGIHERRILGVDPGTNFLGYALISIRDKKIYIMEMGTLKLNHIEEHHKRLERIFNKITSLIDAYKPQELSVEAPFFGKNVQSMLKLGRAQGASMLAATLKNLVIHEYAPKAIKKSITGNGNASKEQVASMLIQIFGRNLDLKELDMTDALGAAVCHYFQQSSKVPTSNSSSKKSNSWGDFIKNNPNRLK